MTNLMSYHFTNPLNKRTHTVLEIMIEGVSYLTAIDIAIALEVGNTGQSVTRLDKRFWRVEDLTASMRKTKLVTKYGALAMTINARKGEIGGLVRDWLLDEVFPQMEAHEHQAKVDAQLEEANKNHTEDEMMQALIESFEDYDNASKVNPDLNLI